jgi:hypothetical protein
LGGEQLQASLSKKFMRPCLNTKSWAWWHMTDFAATVGSINWRIIVLASLGKNLENNQS